MSHESNLSTIRSYLEDSYRREETGVVPKRTDLTFANTIKRLPHAVVLYVDMRGSRKILAASSGLTAVKVHRAFLQAIVYCVENRDGHFRSFNGDGALAFFVDENAASRAVRSAMDLKAYVRAINKLLAKREVASIDFGVGIAQGTVDVAKSGKRGEDATKQDLVWIGTPVYLAVALSECAKRPNNIWISGKVRSSIGKQDSLGVVKDREGKSKWSKASRELGALGRREVRYTSRFFKLG
jgi:class 3 adenylate cyclase